MSGSLCIMCVCCTSLFIVVYKKTNKNSASAEVADRTLFISALLHVEYLAAVILYLLA